jgi:presenilin-like A22 family membrane protease
LFIIPKPHEKGTVNVDLNQPRERISVNIIGLGDYIIPIVLVISANKFIRDATIYSLSIPAIGAAIGGMIGYVLLAWIAEKHPTAHAGLPPINGCAITGFLIACALTGSWGWI